MKKHIVPGSGREDAALTKVLIVDDDVRNIFAMTTMLDQHSMQVIYAENGREALMKLAEHDDVDIVLNIAVKTPEAPKPAPAPAATTDKK